MKITITELKKILNKVTGQLNDYTFTEPYFDFELTQENQDKISELENLRQHLVSAYNLAKVNAIVKIDIYEDVSVLPLEEAYKVKESLTNQGSDLEFILLQHTKRDSKTFKEIAEILTKTEERYLIVDNAIRDTELNTIIEVNITQEQYERIREIDQRRIYDRSH